MPKINGTAAGGFAEQSSEHRRLNSSKKYFLPCIAVSAPDRKYPLVSSLASDRKYFPALFRLFFAAPDRKYFPEDLKA